MSRSYVNSYVEGANAGLLSLAARKIVLDGNIQGTATAGVYQTRTSELLDKMGDQNTLGFEVPSGGTLIIGTAIHCRLYREPGFPARFRSPAVRGGAFAFRIRS